MNRREAMKSIAALVGVALAPPVVAPQGIGCCPAYPAWFCGGVVHSKEPVWLHPGVLVLTSEQQREMQRLVFSSDTPAIYRIEVPKANT